MIITLKYIRRNLVPIILIILSIYDLRIDIRILTDSFTFISLLYTLSDHPLAVTVLITIPRLLKVYNINY